MSTEKDSTAAVTTDGGRRGGEETELVAGGERDVKPLLIEVGVAIALSFAGFVVSQLRPRSCPHTPRLPSRRSLSAESKTGGKDGGGSLKEELRVLRSEGTLPKIINGTSITTVGLSPTNNSSGGEEGFNDSVTKEFEVASMDLETTRTTIKTKNPKVKEETPMEQEIASLKELVWSLRERERSLELQLLDYHGPKEQAAAVRELENRLKISAMESKLYLLKIESLQAENQRLQAQLADYSILMNELEAARANIELLKKKMNSDREQAREIMASLQQRISLLQYLEQKDVKNEAELERKLERLKELEDEALEFRMVNSRLAKENSDLSRKLESTKITASSVLEGAEVDALEEVNRLTEPNDKLMEEIEQLQTDRCADVEELVYLRWVNACLRYELRNYRPPPGKAVARDLSKSLSPRSEAKAKQLILEYANLGGDETSSNLLEVDSEHSSSSQASTGEPDDASIAASSNSTNKAKFISKLKKLVLGKGKQNNRVSEVDRTTASSGNSERIASFSTYLIDDVIGRDLYDSSPSCVVGEFAATNQLVGMETQTIERQHNEDFSSQIKHRLSLDIQMLRTLDLEEAREENGILHRSNCVTSSREKKISFSEGTLINCGQNNLIDKEDIDIPEKAELKMFADALSGSSLQD